ncbi:MAG: ketosteroid isomerase family protein [Candidatus Latescibacterota bacterium]
MTSAEFFQEHVAYITRGDIEGLVRDHYHEDAQMVTFEFVLKGKEAIRKYMQVDSPARTGKVLGMSLDYFTAADDVIMFKASVKTEKFGTIKADDAFYLRDGKILRHIALTIPPDKTREWAVKEVE